MGEFKRGLEPAGWDALDRLASERDNWWKDLLSLWVPSGQPAGAYGLRLALRDGYLNFYRRGQSVARVCFGPRRNGQVEARMEIHAKYVWGEDAPGTYARLRDREVTCKDVPSNAQYAEKKTLQEWIAKAEKWAGEEKCGVDMVVGNNPTVIDLEMGMPAWSGKKSALRVDLAALDVADGQPQLVLWEAKPLNAGALRARTDAVDVVAQMNDYKAYLQAPGHRECLDKAYRTTCSALLKFAAMTGREIKLDDSVRKVAEAKRLEVALEPRLVVFQGVKWREDGEPKLVEFSNGWAAHLGKLRRNGIKVAEGKDPRELRIQDAA